MMNIKIFNSVLLENVPQLFFQALYAATDGLTSTVLFASTASLLSVIGSVLSYCIERRSHEDEMVAVQYYLGLERQRTASPAAPSPIAIPEEGGVDSTRSMTRGGGGASVSSVGGEISNDEKLLILQNRGWRMKLSRSLTELWHIPEKTIEVGATLLTKNGAVTHIVHLMKPDDVEIYGSEIVGVSADFEVTPMFIVRQFYGLRRVEVGEIFKSHFGLSEGFDVEFYDRSGKRKRALSSRLNDVPSMSPRSPSSPNDEEPGQFPYSTTMRSGQLSAAMRSYFYGNNGFGRQLSVEEKMAKMMELADRVTQQSPDSVSPAPVTVPRALRIAVPVGLDDDDLKEDSIELVMVGDAQRFEADIEVEGPAMDTVEEDQTREIMDALRETTGK